MAWHGVTFEEGHMGRNSNWKTHFSFVKKLIKILIKNIN